MRSLLFSAMLLAQIALAQPRQTKITVYTDDFSGMKEELGVGRYNNLYLAQSGISIVGSISVPTGMKVTIYSKDNYSGNSLTLTEDATMRYLKAKGFAEIGLRVSMIVEELAQGELPVPPPFITLYENNFSGASKNLGEGRYESHDFGRINNDQVSSVKVPNGMKVTLYEHSGYTGRALVLTKDATADFLTKNKFNDATSSVLVESLPVEEVKPVPVVVPVKKDPVVAPAPVVVDEIVTIFQGDFNGISKTLKPGKYTLATLGIGNDELSSIFIKPGYRVTLFEEDNFKGRSLKLTEGVNTARLTQLNFNNLTSSLIIEEIPRVKIYEDSPKSGGATLLPGRYDLRLLMDYNIMEDEISFVQVPAGYRVILYEQDGFKGRALMLTQDASTEYLTEKNFNNITSSLTVEEWEEIVPDTRLMATIYDLNFNGRSQTLPVGTYDYQDLVMGNNAVSSVTVPYGLRVTLYEYGAQEGRSMTLTQNAGTQFMERNQFDNITTSIVVQQRPESELYVTIFADRFAGSSQQLKPGKYGADDLLIGNKQLSSIRVPQGLLATLFENRNFTGMSLTLDRDKDFSDISMFNNYYSSVIVEDITTPKVTPVATPVVVDAITAPTEYVVDTATQLYVATESDCSLTEKEYYTALKAIEAKSFSAEKMQTARIATEGKCLTNEQIRAIAKTFDFEDQTLEFVLYAYDHAAEKSTYYTLEDVFKYMSSIDRFNKFLSEKR